MGSGRQAWGLCWQPPATQRASQKASKPDIQACLNISQGFCMGLPKILQGVPIDSPALLVDLTTAGPLMDYHMIL